jgi:hypothetical protein
MEIRGYADFVSELLRAGFSLGGGAGEGIYSVVPFTWREYPPYRTPVSWHTGNPETDPWEWRFRVLRERDDIAYAKVFFKKSGYITREWYPKFLAARRRGRTFDAAYSDGDMSYMSKRLYKVVRDNGAVAAHDLRRLAEVSREDKSRYDSAVFELHMKLFITICDGKQKASAIGESYGWESAVFCTTEEFWGAEMTQLAREYDPAEAAREIETRIYELNPNASANKIKKFIFG